MDFKYITGCLLAGFVSAAITDYRIGNDIKENNIGGYHCTPITTHTSLESAKAQVRVYQSKTGTIHGIGVEK